MRAHNKRLTLLSEAEKLALYSLPDFDDFQRAEYFALSETELALVLQRNYLGEQIYCLLQIGYFKAKQTFFRFTLERAPAEDLSFILQRYFPDVTLVPKRSVSRYECYSQRDAIIRLFNYRLWSESDCSTYLEQAAQLAKRDVTSTFILSELISNLDTAKIIRPGYTSLQTIIADALAIERQRLEQLINNALDNGTRANLDKLLLHEDTLSELAALKQDAKHFGYGMMTQERHKQETLESLYRIAKILLPTLDISQQNMNYYASLAHYYTVYDLRNLKSGQTYLYLLCYAWQRYRQLNDNLAAALSYHMRKLEDETKLLAERQFFGVLAKKRQESPKVGQLLLLYVDEKFKDTTLFGTVRKQAYKILPKKVLLSTGKRLCEKVPSQMELRWKEIDKVAARCRKNLRPLYMALEFSSTDPIDPWLKALRWMKTVYARQQRLSQRPMSEIPDGTIPKRLRPYLLEMDEEENAVAVNSDRYEFWIYRQVRKRFDVGDLYLNDSVTHRRFSDELVSIEQKAEVLEQMNIPWLSQPLNSHLDELFAELNELWTIFDRKLSQGELKHLGYDLKTKRLTWHKPKVDKELALQVSFYAELPSHDIADIFRFINERCDFLSALTPLQPRYAKKIADQDSLMAVIMAQALNHGNLSMADTCDISYHVLDATHQQYLRLSTLQASNDLVSNFTAKLPIFPHYSFGLESIYGSVDGQKFESASPTVKARYSRKYFGGRKGVVAYTLLAHHLPLRTELIGAHEHESYFVFDICYHNTSSIMPTTITGDMHCINAKNWAVMRWFGLNLAPRFTNLQTQLKHIFCAKNPSDYETFLIKPVAQIDRQLIVSEKANIDQIVATLALKDMSQSTLVRKLCTMSTDNKTNKAISEYDNLVRSIYTLKYLIDPRFQSDVHRSQNRLESYHQFRSFMSQVSGKKRLIGRTDLDIAISNECGRLLANVVIAYNSIILSTLLERFQAVDDKKALALLQKISPVAWQHIYFLGHYIFRDNKNPINLETMLAHIKLESSSKLKSQQSPVGTRLKSAKKQK